MAMCEIAIFACNEHLGLEVLQVIRNQLFQVYFYLKICFNLEPKIKKF